MSRRLAPSDARVALLSFPRRYREALAARRLADDELEALLYRPGPRGRSIAELVVDTTRSLSLLERALDEVLVRDRPNLHPAVSDRSARSFDVDAHGSLDGVLDELDDVAASFASRVTSIPSEEWQRTAPVAGGGSVTALDILEEAVATGVENLREIDETLRYLRA